MLWIVRGDSQCFYCTGFLDVMRSYELLRQSREHATIIPLQLC